MNMLSQKIYITINTCLKRSKISLAFSNNDQSDKWHGFIINTMRLIFASINGVSY